MSVTAQPPPSGSGPVPQLQGATVQPVYVERHMRVYAIHEHEAETLATLNTQSAAFYAVASFLLSAAISIWVNALFYAEPTPPTAVVMVWFGAPVIALLSLVFFALGRHAAKRRASTWQAIKDTSVTR